MKTWLTYHSLRDHLVAPIWLRVPAKWRWRIVHHLDRSDKRAWCSLVDAALAEREDDACDVRTPLRLSADYCRSTCTTLGLTDHRGQHECSCYCGKFAFTAADGASDRRVAR